MLDFSLQSNMEIKLQWHSKKLRKWHFKYYSSNFEKNLTCTLFLSFILEMKKNWESKWGLETRKNKQPAEYCCIMFESELENWCLAFACEHYAIEIHSKTTGSTNIY